MWRHVLVRHIVMPLIRANAAEPNIAPIQAPGDGNKKAHRYGRAFSPFLVAWGGIEPPTQGFSTSMCIFCVNVPNGENTGIE
jgi:hypothetical protein